MVAGLHDKTERAYKERISRRSDFNQLAHEAQHNPDPAARESARHGMEVLQRESKDIRSMREALIKAHRDGKPEEVKDIHDYAKSKSKYQNE